MAGMEAIKRAVDAMGGGAKLAAAIGVAGPTVSQWIKGVRKVPVERCMQIEQHTGVPCEQLRPDVAWHVLRGPSTPQKAA